MSEQQEYDVIVVGAGPAGLMASRKAAEAGASTLLLERENSLGKKPCGEAVSVSTLEDAGVKGGRFIRNRVEIFRVHAPDERKYVDILSRKLGTAGYVIEKGLFLKELAYLAVKRGVEMRMGSPVLDLRRVEGWWEVLVKQGAERRKFRGKIVIGCDGVNSVVAGKALRVKKPEVIPCFQYKMVNCGVEDPHTLEVYLGKEVAPGGYVWLFPKDGGEANVGIGVRGAPAKPYLDRFLSSHPELFGGAGVVEVGAAPVPVGGEVERVVGEGVMVCGDAGGQVIPLTGGGIHSSVVAGKMAGEVAGEAVKGGRELQEYPRRYEEWSERISRSLKVLRLIEKLSDKELNQLADLLTGQDVVDLANGTNLKRVGRKLLRHPHFALRLARGLLGG
ncbi:MAG: NAD(P)/FAD-dependent oxidoreductase [Candidatus Hadarchaeales archaeon]